MDLSQRTTSRPITPPLLPAIFFRFGTLTAYIRTNDEVFRDRFSRLFFDCRVAPEAGSDLSAVSLEVIHSPTSDTVVIGYSSHDADVDTTVLQMLCPEVKLERCKNNSSTTWRSYERCGGTGSPVLAIRGGKLLISKQLPWQLLAGHYFIHHIMRLQPELLFLHGASLTLGASGVFIGGEKGAGKSTLALALAARGHGFLGDEIAAIEARTGICLPFRRAVSARVGPQSTTVQDYFSSTRLEQETLPDGSTRTRVNMSDIFPDAIRAGAPLSSAIFLCGFADSPRIERFDFSRQHLSMLGPLYAMFTSDTIGKRVLGLLKLFASVPCHKLWAGGSPDHTAELIENTVESRWHTASRNELNS